MRCLALAQYWKDQGGHAAFIGFIENRVIRKRIEEEGFSFYPIESPWPNPKDLSKTCSIIDSFQRKLKDPRALWVVLDGYSFSTEYHDGLSRTGCRLLILDDMIHLPWYDADIILNQNSIPNDIGYPCSPKTLILSGPRYRLIRREFVEDQTARPQAMGRIERLLVFLGGADSKNVTLRVVRALKALNKKQLKIKIITGPTNVHIESLKRETADNRQMFRIIDRVKDLPSLIKWADLGIAAGGGSCWEMAFLGLPLVLIPVNNNQERNVCELCNAGAAISPGRVESFSEQRLASVLDSMISSPGKLQQMSQKGRSIMDGKGAFRTVCLMQVSGGNELNPSLLTLRPAVGRDALQLYKIASDPLVRINSFSSNPFTYKEHLQWFEKKIGNPTQTSIWVYEYAGIITAQIRYDKSDGHFAEIDFSVHPQFRGKGLGTSLLMQTRNMAVERLNVRSLRGFVLPGNEASKACFQKAGFIEKGIRSVADKLCYLYEWKMNDSY